MTFITTYSGNQFDPCAPSPSYISIEDIAHALSNICRFNGHCRCFYSVAQHSVLVAQSVKPQFALAALLHDASEAYICDIPRPLKKLPELLAYNAMEQIIQCAIMSAFGIVSTPESHAAIKEADDRMLATEARDLMPNQLGWDPLPPPHEWKIAPLNSHAAKLKFLGHFHHLTAPIA